MSGLPLRGTFPTQQGSPTCVLENAPGPGHSSVLPYAGRKDISSNLRSMLLKGSDRSGCMARGTCPPRALQCHPSCRVMPPCADPQPVMDWEMSEGPTQPRYVFFQEGR